jgi:hypothetical protein
LYHERSRTWGPLIFLFLVTAFKSEVKMTTSNHKRKSGRTYQKF